MAKGRSGGIQDFQPNKHLPSMDVLLYHCKLNKFRVIPTAFGCLQIGFTRVGVLDQRVKKRVDPLKVRDLTGCTGQWGTGRVACTA